MNNNIVVNKLVSVIIPVFNCEDYIRVCILSVINQTYSNLEIIVINDGSTDNSEYIINQLSLEEPRLKYFKKENGGPSSSKNYGIQKAKGDFITFVDSDDWIDSTMIQKLLEKLVDQGSDFSCCAYNFHIDDKTIKSFIDHQIISTNPKENFMNLISNYSNPLSGIPYGGAAKLFKKSILIKNKIEFDEHVHLTEDVKFLILYFNFIDSSSFIEDSFYHVRIRKGSTTTIYRSKQFDLHIENYYLLMKLLNKKSNNIENSISFVDINLIRLFIETLIFLFKSSKFVKGKEKRFEYHYLNQSGLIKALYKKYSFREMIKLIKGFENRLFLFISYYFPYFLKYYSYTFIFSSLKLIRFFR